jgi:glutathionylspermidine synthase
MGFEILGTSAENREARVKQLAELGFTWADLGDEAYWLDQLVVIEEPVYQELLVAGNHLWSIFDKTARFVIGRSDLYEALSIPEVLWEGLNRLVPNPPGLMSRYARFDFALSESGQIKLLELNADTPTGYVEASIATPWMCEQLGIFSPNVLMPELIRRAWNEDAPEYAACIAYGEHAEDTGTIDVLVQHSGRTVTCTDCLKVWVDDGIVKDLNNKEIRSMFALYPKEWMGIDDGGEALAYAVEEGNLKLFNSLHAIILQSKGLQAVIWGLHELQAGFFTELQHEMIEAYMLPTYNMPVLEGNYVSKSMFGREGGSVQMYNQSGELEEKDAAGFDTSLYFSRVYQQRADLPKLQLDGQELHLLTGLFVINGVPCGLLGRAGGLITGNSSHFVAMGVRRT